MKTIARNIFIILVLTGFFLPQPLLAQTSAPTTSPTPAAAPSTLPNGDQRPAAADTQNPVDDDDWTFIAGWIANVMIALGGAVAWLGGYLLDLAVWHTVIEAGVEFQGGIGVAVNAMWQIVRDIFNLIFIFALIYVGLKTILNSGDTGTKKLLGGIIIAALFINFSLFISKLIVDFSNLAAYQIYAQVVQHDPNANTDELQELGDVAGLDDSNNASALGERTIGGAFMNALRLTSFANSDAIQNTDALNSSTQIIIFGFLMMLFMFFAGFAFAAGAILLISRFVLLVIFMVFSPAMFLIFLFPGLAKVGNDWWRKFISNAFAAPAYLFMVLMTLVVIERLQLAPDNAAFADILTNTDGSVFGDLGGLLIFFFVATAFMYASVLVAQKMGAAGADTAMKVTNYGRDTIRGAVTAGPRRLASGTVGAISAGIQDQYNKFDEKDGKWARRFRSVGLDKTIIQSTEAGKKAKMGWSTSREDRVKWRENREKELARAQAVSKLENGLKVTTPQADRERALYSASNPQVLKLAEEDSGKEQLIANAHLLSGSQYKALMDEKELGDDFKTKLKTARQGGIKAMLGEGVHVGKLSKDRINALGADFLTQPQNAIRLSAKQIDDLDMADVDKNQIKDARNKALETLAKEDKLEGVTDLSRQNIFGGRSTEESGKLPPAIFAIPEMQKYVTPNILGERLKNNVTDEEFTAIVNSLQKYLTEEATEQQQNTWRGWIQNNNIGNKLALAGLKIPHGGSEPVA